MSLLLNGQYHLDLILQINSYGYKGASSQVIYSDNFVVTNIHGFFETHFYGHLYGSSW